MSTASTPARAVSDGFTIGDVFTLTSADLGGGHFGFFAGFGGSITPAALRGFTITVLDTFPTATTVLQVAGDAPEDLFASITILGTTRTTPPDVYFNNGSETYWSWTATNVLDGVTGDVQVVVG